MFAITTNINQVVGNLIAKTNRIASPQGTDKLLRSMAIDTAGEMAYRIHTIGENADGSQIGTYSKEYMKVRTGTFSNNHVSGGKNRGQPKQRQAGVFSKGKNKGATRPSYNRTADTKIIFSLTRQMENDFGLKETNEPIKTATGYGVGFKNPLNADKAGWLSEKHPNVYKLSQKEREHFLMIVNDFVANAFDTR